MPLPRTVRFVIIGTVAAATTAATGTAQTPDAPSRGAAAVTLDSVPRERLTFVPVGSGLLRVAHDSVAWLPRRRPGGKVGYVRDPAFAAGVASVLMRTETGTFRIRGDSSVLAAWADTAAALPAPVLEPAADGHEPSYVMKGVMLGEVGSTTVVRLTRLRVPRGDSLPAYQVDATNGAWDGSLRLDPLQARAFFAALRGTAAESPDDPDEPLSALDAADRAERLGGPEPVYPPEMVHRAQNGEIQMEFVIGTDGRAEPSSLTLLGDASPEFAAAVRESVLKSLYRPARRGGVPTRQLVQQGFTFELR